MIAFSLPQSAGVDAAEAFEGDLEDAWIGFRDVDHRRVEDGIHLDARAWTHLADAVGGELGFDGAVRVRDDGELH